ncbi:Ig-like domain-containing protein [Streptomyces sp. NPDC056528]|uniref:Ig-like domain-containing protein n=1 Tax=Streptomyces sp. NPDC056528 TaxID=3345854 RepID=UPI0036A0CBB9
MNHLLCSGKAVGTEDDLPGVAHAALYCSVPPFSGVAPGDVVQLALSVAVENAPFGYAYLQEKYFADAAEVLAFQQMEYFPRQRWYRVRAEPGANGVGFLSVRVKRPRKNEPRLRPQIAVAVPGRESGKKVRTASLRDRSLLIHTLFAPGLRIVTGPGVPGSADALAAVPPGSVPAGVTQPRHGTARFDPDGTLTYLPYQGFTGYDRFEYTVTGPEGEKVTAPVNVHVGGLEGRAGVFPEHQRLTTEFRSWQWPELTGAMPWPEAARPPRNGQVPA